MPENKMNGTLQFGEIMGSFGVVFHITESKCTMKAKIYYTKKLNNND